MPTYAYRCTNCAHEFEAFQKFADDPLTECPECGELIRRVFQPVGIVFKGSGWYINDSRKSTESSTEGEPKAKTPPADSKAETSTTPKTTTDSPATPAPAKVAAD